MVSQCKVCGATTAGHRQYCPDCRKGRVYGGSRGYVSSRDRQATREFFQIGLFMLVWSICAIAVSVYVIVLGGIFILEYALKTIFYSIKRFKNNKQKVFVINSFERGLGVLIKRGPDFLFSLKVPGLKNSNSKLPAPARTSFSYKNKLSNKLVSYGS